MPPRIKYNTQGRPYYDYGWGGKAAEFTDAFVKGMGIAQQMKDHEEARRQQRRSERQAYDKLAPEEQQQAISKMTAQDLVDLGLVVKKGDVIPQGPVEQGEPPLEQQGPKEYQTGKGPFAKKWVLRKDAVRDLTVSEQAQREVDRTTLATVGTKAQLDIKIAELTTQKYTQDIATGKFNYDTAIRDDKTREEMKVSKDPFLRSLGHNRPMKEIIEADLRAEYPDLANVQAQIEFGVGPAARGALYAKNWSEAKDKFPSQQAAQVAEAMTDAMLTGDYKPLQKLSPQLSSFAMQNMNATWEQIALHKRQILDSENQFLQQQATQLMGASNWNLNLDTAKQWVTKNMYGTPMSEGAAKQIGGFQEIVEGQRQTALATAYYDLRAKQGKDARETRESLRSSIGTLLQMHKEKIGGKALDQQMLAIKDELIKQEAAAMGIDLTAANGSFWENAIWGAAKATMGGMQFAGAVTTDEGKYQASVGGRIAKDILGSVARHTLGQENINKIAQGQQIEGEDYAQLGGAISYMAGVVTNPERATVDWSLSGTKLGNSLKFAMEKTPGFRIAYQENLKSAQLSIKASVDASNDPLVVEDGLKKIEEISAILRGMGVK